MKQRLLISLALLAFAALPALADDAALLERMQAVETQVNDADIDGLEKSLEGLEAMDGSSPDVRYGRAYCRYRLASLSMGDSSAASGAREHLEAAQSGLEELLESLPSSSSRAVEAMSLLSGVMGTRIGLDPGLGMRLGPKSGRYLAKAEALSPDNPRVHLQEGISKFNTPKSWGGSMKKAESSLRKAVALFAENPEQATWPNWGYLDALAWLGQALAAQDKIDEARAVYQQALAVNPEMGWIRYQLLPALDG
ncbi:MAG: hypothetical protein AAGK22_13855 [Acidobacteriota bacterium]